jgi:hypothetical protein
MYEAGATLEEVGRAYGISRERVRQIFRDHGLPVRSVKDARALQRARQTSQYAPCIKNRFRELRDVNAVAQELQLPRNLVAEIVQGSFTPAERRRPKHARKKYSDEELIRFLQVASTELGGVLTAQGYTDFARTRRTRDGRPWPTHQTHALRFGSWRAAVNAAGLAANPSSPIAGQMIFEDGHCIDALRAAARAVGRAPTADEYDEFAKASNGALPSQATVRHRLGRWYQALDRADL